MHYIEKVKLADFAHSYPHTLSGGMKQRVAIARGMAMEPDILLMDEPFAALDALTRSRMQDELLSLWDETRFTVLFVTHSIPEAIKLGNRILLLSPHPGQVKAEGRGQHGGGDFLFHQQKTHLALPRRFHQFHRLATRVSDDEGGAGFLERCCKHFDGGGHCEVSRKFFSVSATMTEPVSASNGAEGVRR